ncbi:MAG: 30S ribosomal protein S3ae [Candidatus Micrarchaeia archaeon]|jgi:small subunit ribosomal protein S3Ae
MAKKVVDTWKSKSWYAVLAPKFMNEVQFAQVPALDDEHLMNRVIEVPLKEITKDIAHMYTNVRMRVTEIKGKTAYAKFIGHSIAREYLQTLVRRHREALWIVLPVSSKDGVEFKVKALVVTAGRASSAKKTALRNAMTEFLKNKASTNTFGNFINLVLYGKASSEAVGVLKKIVPIRRVEIYKTELKEVFDVPEKQELPEREATEVRSEASPQPQT